jgi:hypothetical protein
MDPDLELQGAIVTALKADPTIQSLVSDRVYDRVEPVPTARTFPYITYGPADMGDDSADCITAYTIAVQVHTWSRAPGYPECKRINHAVRRALHDSDVELNANALVFLEHDRTLTVRDPDGLTSHGVVMFNALIEEKE